jgi:hypothetical protein
VSVNHDPNVIGTDGEDWKNSDGQR